MSIFIIKILVQYWDFVASICVFSICDEPDGDDTHFPPIWNHDYQFHISFVKIHHELMKGIKLVAAYAYDFEFY